MHKGPWQQAFKAALSYARNTETLTLHRPLSWKDHPQRPSTLSGDMPMAPQAKVEALNTPQTIKSTEGLHQFAMRTGIAIEDHRSKGGSLWLRVDNADPGINRQLTIWGFRHRPGRGWWRAA